MSLAIRIAAGLYYSQAMRGADEDALWQALDAVDAGLAEGDLASARAALARAHALGGEGHPDVVYAQACLQLHGQGLPAAGPLLQRVVELDDGHADAHHLLAQLAEEQGDRDQMIARFLKVQALDARSDRAARIGSRTQLDHIERVAREVLSALPSPFVERLEHVPVVLERRPSRALVREGFDPRALGLFEGPTDSERETPAPTRIVLFVNNLLAEFSAAQLEAEIEVTLLHEIGHFFGLDEDDMVRLGLD